MAATAPETARRKPRAPRPKLSPAERFAAFERIRAYYHARDQERLAKGKLSLGATSHGFWGTTNLNDCYELCKRIKLETKRGFLDLGSGDGRVAAVASLFTDAVGVEGDEALSGLARAAKEALGLERLELKHGDYLDEDFNDYDVLFSFPDQDFSDALLAKLHACTATLYVYTDIYLPRGLRQGRTIWIEQLPVRVYHCGDRAEG